MWALAEQGILGVKDHAGVHLRPKAGATEERGGQAHRCQYCWAALVQRASVPHLLIAMRIDAELQRPGNLDPALE